MPLNAGYTGDPLKMLAERAGPGATICFLCGMTWSTRQNARRDKVPA